MPTLPERLLLVSLDDDGQPRDPRSAPTAVTSSGNSGGG
jgi:hypothetical protein